MKESLEGQEEKLSYFARENSIDMRELEEALMVLRKKKDAEMKNSVPSFLDEVDGVANKDLKAQLSELQVQVRTVTKCTCPFHAHRFCSPSSTWSLSTSWRRPGAS